MAAFVYFSRASPLVQCGFIKSLSHFWNLWYMYYHFFMQYFSAIVSTYQLVIRWYMCWPITLAARTKFGNTWKLMWEKSWVGGQSWMWHFRMKETDFGWLPQYGFIKWSTVGWAGPSHFHENVQNSYIFYVRK